MKRESLRVRAGKWAAKARDTKYAEVASLDRFVGLIDGYEAGYRAAKRNRGSAMKRRPFEYCPACSGTLDTGWECNSCERDWMWLAYPWWELVIDRIKLVAKRNRGERDE